MLNPSYNRMGRPGHPAGARRAHHNRGASEVSMPPVGTWMSPNRNISVDIGEGPWKIAPRILIMDEGLCESAGIRPLAGIPDRPLPARIPFTIMTSMSLRPPKSSPIEVPRRPIAVRALMSPWKWMAVTCLILGISGGVRYSREWKFASHRREERSRPVPPGRVAPGRGDLAGRRGLGMRNWIRRWPGSPGRPITPCEPISTRSPASRRRPSSSTARRPWSSPTPPSSAIRPPATKPSGGRSTARSRVPGVTEPVRYRWAIFMKRTAGINRYEETYYTFRHNGDWLPDARGRWKMFRYHPGIFKVQIAHPISSLTENGKGGPCELLLTELVRQLEEQLTPGGPGQAVTAEKSPETAAPRGRNRSEGRRPAGEAAPPSGASRRAGAGETARVMRRMTTDRGASGVRLPGPRDPGDRPRGRQDQHADPAHQQHHQQGGNQVDGQGHLDEPPPTGPTLQPTPVGSDPSLHSHRSDWDRHGRIPRSIRLG